MKTIKWIIIGFGFLLGINACCTKKYCTGADEIYQIDFYNFAQTDVDTIKIISYSKNSGFTDKKDSSITRANLTGDYFSAYTNNKIDMHLDYKIILVSTGQVFTLTEFEIEKKGCNSCFPFRPQHDFYNELSSYKINEQKQTENRIRIYQ